MADLSLRSRNSVELQREMFRLAEQEHGLTLAVLSRTRGIPFSTLRGWATGTQMPLWAAGELRLPNDLISLVLNPWGKHVADDEPDDGDLDELGREAAAFTSEYVEAISDGIVTPIEKNRLKHRARRLAPKARAVAA